MLLWNDSTICSGLHTVIERGWLSLESLRARSTTSNARFFLLLNKLLLVSDYDVWNTVLTLHSFWHS